MGSGKEHRDLTPGGDEERWAAYRADNLADALGMTLVSGDPTTNLLIAVPGRSPEGGSGSSARSAGEALDVVMRGTHDGRATELVVMDGAAMTWGVLVDTFTYAYDGRLATDCTSSEPPFEVLNRERTPAMTPSPVLEAEAQPFGDPQLDTTYALRGGSPGLGPRLVEAVRPLLPIEWIHLLWDGEHVSYVLHPYSTFGLGQGPTILQSLAAAAAAIEG